MEEFCVSAQQTIHSRISPSSDRRVATESYSDLCDTSFDYDCDGSADEAQQQHMEESMTPEDFYRVCHAKVKISSRNKTLLEKWCPNAEEKKFRTKQTRSPPKTETSHKLASTLTGESTFSSCDAQSQHTASCLVLLFCTGTHDALNLIPDYELERCKSICCEVMSRGEHSSPEACFALGRLLTYEGDYEQALRLVSDATARSGDDLHHTWELLLRAMIAKRKPVADDGLTYGPCKLYSVWSSIVAACSTREQKSGVLSVPAPKDVSRLSVEQLWCYLELSLADSDSGLGDPRRYASELRDSYSYFGYLAWALIYLRSPDWSRGLDILQELIRTHPRSPEAYLKLWEVYYRRLKDYENAMDTIEQAFVKAADSSQFKVLISLRYAKTMWRLKRVDACLDFLQTQYIEQSCAYIGFLYLYGRLAVQAEDLKERVSGVNALAETAKLACRKRLGLAYYWTAKAHLLARETAQAVAAFQQAAQLLTPDQAKKISDTHAYLTGMTTFTVSLHRLQTVSSVKDGESAVAAQRLMRTASMCDENAGEMEYARVLFRTGMETSALAMIHEVCDRKKDSLTANLLKIKLLKSGRNFEGMKTEAENCIEKGDNFPLSELIQLTVQYAQSLSQTGKAHKSLLVLKSLGKLHPPVDYHGYPYIALIQRASSVLHLTKTPGDHHYRPDLSLSLATAVPRDDFPTLLREIVQLTADEAKDKYEPRPTPSTHESPSIFQRSFRSPLNLTLEAMECDTVAPARRRFALSSDVRFLYEIGKLAVRQGVAHEDGYWALKEYLKIVKRRLPGPGSEPGKRVEKARTMMFNLLREVKTSEESMCRSFEEV